MQWDWRCHLSSVELRSQLRAMVIRDMKSRSHNLPVVRGRAAQSILADRAIRLHKSHSPAKGVDDDLKLKVSEKVSCTGRPLTGQTAIVRHTIARHAMDNSIT